MSQHNMDEYIEDQLDEILGDDHLLQKYLPKIYHDLEQHLDQMRNDFLIEPRQALHEYLQVKMREYTDQDGDDMDEFLLAKLEKYKPAK